MHFSMNWDWEKLQEKRQRQPGNKSGGNDRNDGSPPPLSPGNISDKFKKFKKIPFPAGKILILVIILAWASTGIFIVEPEEKGIVLRFGAYNRTVDPGPHYHLPYPIESVIKPKYMRVQRVEVGYRSQLHSSGQDVIVRSVPEEASMLTSDENIVNVQFSVQYRIRDPQDYLFHLARQSETVKSASEAAMREVIGRSRIDAALTEGKGQIQEETRELLQEILDRYKAGILVIGVQMQDVHAPPDVMNAFRDVASAREERSTTINVAEGYRNRIIPEARGQAAEIINQAEAYRETVTRRARGESDRFLAVLAEYNKAKDITKKRMYLETMEEILSAPGMEKIIVSGEAGSRVLPLLPLAAGSTDLSAQNGAPSEASTTTSGISAAPQTAPAQPSRASGSTPSAPRFRTPGARR